jgi:hypothetical protein
MLVQKGNLEIITRKYLRLKTFGRHDMAVSSRSRHGNNLKEGKAGVTLKNRQISHSMDLEAIKAEGHVVY